MTIIQYQKAKCDNCGKIEETKPIASLPVGWFTINVTQWHGTSGRGRFHKDVCSQKCAIELMHKTKELDPDKPMRI